MFYVILVTKYAIADQPLRNSGEFAKYTLLYSIAYYGLDKLGIATWGKAPASSFVASFICGLRNGKAFAFRNGMGGVGNTFFHDVINKIKK